MALEESQGLCSATAMPAAKVSQLDPITHCDVSVVVPVLNEIDTLTSLVEKVHDVLSRAAKHYEIWFVDDGSTDGSRDKIEELGRRHAEVGAIFFRRNFGKAAALDAAFRQCRGDVVITMDADLQDDPEEFPALIERLQEGYDVVSGWKKNRRDPLGKTLPSKLFNWIVSRTAGVALHDFNCGLKAYRREALGDLNLYGEMHRYIPVLLFWQGFRITEMPVTHHPRKHGVSKYGWRRLVKGFFDWMTVLLNTRYQMRPLHLFGTVGAGLGLVGFSTLSYLTVLWFLGNPIGNRPLLFLGMLLVMVGVQLLSTGLLGEFVHRGRMSQPRNYHISHTVDPNMREP